MVIGALVLRYTDVGLKVRAMVDSPAITGLSGSSPTAISVGVWAVATFFAGLAGVLTAPLNGLDPSQFTLLIAASFAAVVAARLRSLPVAVLVGLAMGVATSLIQRYLPSNSQWTTGLINAIPFIVIALFLIYSLIRGGRVGETEGWGGALDRAITPQGESRLAGSTSNAVETASLNFIGKYAGPLFLIIAVAVAPLLVSGYWVGLFPQAFALAIICLSWTIVTGEGGMLWLCQITFAGVGALTTAQLAESLRLARSGRRRRRRPDRGCNGSDCRLPEHPARRSLRRAGHLDVRAPHGDARFHLAQLRERGHRADPQPA